ncbi:MAG: acyltransferase [Phycisphaerae bacterium]|nr:acyltransferase [Phycisphaerae bacterium]
MAVRKPRVLFLDVVRGLAVLFVLFQHLTEDVAPPFLSWGYRWMNYGRLGVALFFIVSGFVIPYSLERANSLKVFWVSRVFRLYPIYWFSILVVLAFHFIGHHVWDQLGVNMAVLRMEKDVIDSGHYVRTYLINITMAQEFLKTPHVMGLYWTLSLEMVWYVLFTILFILGINKRSVLWCWTGIGALIAISLGFKFVKHRYAPAMGSLTMLVYATYGTVLFRYYAGLVSGRDVWAVTVGLIVATAIGFGFSFPLPRQIPANVVEQWSCISMITSHIGAILIFAIIFSMRAREFAFPLRWIGTVSYSIYLLHFPVWTTLEVIPHQTLLSGICWELLVTACAIGVSSITYMLVEQPAIDLGKRLLHRPKPATELGQPVTEVTPAGPVSVIPSR